MALQTSRVKFVFAEEDLEVVIGDAPTGDQPENAFVGGENKWTFDSFVNWEFWWPDFPVLVYFKETQTKPEGQVRPRARGRAGRAARGLTPSGEDPLFPDPLQRHAGVRGHAGEVRVHAEQRPRRQVALRVPPLLRGRGVRSEEPAVAGGARVRASLVSFLFRIAISHSPRLSHVATFVSGGAHGEVCEGGVSFGTARGPRGRGGP